MSLRPRKPVPDHSRAQGGGTTDGIALTAVGISDSIVAVT